MPDLVRHDLVLRGLLDKANFLRLRSLVQFIQRLAFKKNLTVSQTVRSQNRFQLPQQGGFAAAGWAAKHHKFPGMHRQRQIVNDILRLIGIGKT